MRKHFIFLLLFSFALANVHAQSHSSSDMASNMSAYPAHDQQQFNQRMEAIGQSGENNLEKMAEGLQPEPQADNTQLQYAINGFSTYVMQNNKEDWRAMAVQAYGKALNDLNNWQNKQFLIQQLQLIGKDDAVPFLQPFLQNEKLVHPAAQALATINTPATQKALIQGLQKASEATRIPLIEALGKSRTKEAASVIVPFVKSNDTALQKVALFALANIGDPASSKILLKAAKANDYHYNDINATSDLLLYIRRLMAEGNSKTAKKLTRRLLKKTKKDDYQAVHLAALQMQQQLEGKGNDTLPANTLSQEEKQAGFELLFNGKNLDGWIGNKEGYLVQNGNIVVHPGHGSGGNLYTEGEYGNFIFRFQFQLTPGANNGIGIRTPAEGDAAYVGMEIQVLDNTADKFKNLHPYQYHGSVYGVIPAKHGYLKPVGEWNKEEIKAVGPHIMVTLNGHVIVDGNIDKASENGTMDHKSHPGLHNKSGHIGFLGHGSVVRFRNIRIKQLD